MRCSKCNGLLIQCSETCMVCGKTNPVFAPKVQQFTDPISDSLSKVSTRDTSSRIHFVITSGRRQVY